MSSLAVGSPTPPALSAVQCRLRGVVARAARRQDGMSDSDRDQAAQVLSSWAAAGMSLAEIVAECAMAEADAWQLHHPADGPVRRRLLGQLVHLATSIYERTGSADDCAADRRSQRLLTLLSPQATEADRAAAARHLGLELDRQYSLLLARGPGRDALADSLCRRDAVVSVIGEELVALVPPALSSVREDVTIAVAGPVAPLGLAAAVSEAEQVLRTALAFGCTGPVRLNELGLRPHVVHDGALQQQLHDRYLAPLIAGSPIAEDLLHTVDVYLQSGSDRRRAGTRLHLHANTVAYRIARFCSLTGAELSDPEQIAEIWWLCRAREVRGA